MAKRTIPPEPCSAQEKYSTFRKLKVRKSYYHYQHGDFQPRHRHGEIMKYIVDHPQYNQLYSTVLAAFMSGKKVHAYAHTCTEIGWHGGSFSTLNGAGSLYIKH